MGKIKHYSAVYKAKMVSKLIGKDGSSAHQLAREVGVSQSTLSKWRREASTVPGMVFGRRSRTWALDRKIEILAAAAKLDGELLLAYLEREEVTIADLDRWRSALQDDGVSAAATPRRIRRLERELARKDKALAEAAALLILKKKLEDYLSVEEDEDTDEENEK